MYPHSMPHPSIHIQAPEGPGRGLAGSESGSHWDAPTPAMGHTVGRGLTWVVGNTAISKVVSLGAFVILGWLLSDQDFGLYALAFSLAAFVQVFRDGGVVQLLIQRGEREYQRLLGPVFWMAFGCNLATGLALAAIAPLAAAYYNEPRLAQLLLVIAASLPMGTPGAVMSARLQMDLRFGVLTRIQMASAVIRSGGTVLLAFLGAGPLSFVLPLPVIALFEGVCTYAVTRQAPWRRHPGFTQWRGMVSSAKWLIILALSSAALNQGAYLMLGAIVKDAAVVGVFAWAFQLISQVDSLLSATAATVLFPALSRLNLDPERQENAAVRSTRLLMVFAAPATVGLALVIDPLEKLVWHGRWDAAVFPVQALAVFYSARVLFAVPAAALQARGLFRANAILILWSGAGMMLAAAGGALADKSADSIALWIGVYIGVGCGVLTLHGMKLVGVHRRRMLGAVIPAALIAAAAAAVALAIDWTTGRAFAPVKPGAVRLGLRLVLLGSVFTGVYGILLRLLLPGAVREILSLAPARVRPFAAMVLGLRAANGTAAGVAAVPDAAPGYPRFGPGATNMDPRVGGRPVDFP